MVTILLAEKDSEIRNLLKKLLKREGYNVLEVRDIKDALEQYKKLKDKPDLIILSSHLQKRNGIGAVKELLLKIPQCNILYMTGDPRIEKQQLLHENLKVKTKPVKTSDLLTTIQEIVQA
ncbi:MAG: response regulator [Asgard group archaeon]|nr:response regulator [Asgard group archaeon]